MPPLASALMASAELDGRVAVITGAGSGIGRATAMRFAAEGARLVINDIDADAAETTVDAIVAAGGVATAHQADVGDSEAVDAMIAAAVDTYGRLDILHNNAGYGIPGRVAEITDDQFAEVLRVNLCGVLYGTRAALRFMVDQGSGSIVNTASNAGFGATRERAGYGAAKAAVINLTRSTAVENGRFGVRANAICPGPIETPAFVRFAPDIDYYRAQIPLGRLGAAEDVAELALFLASDRSSYLTGTAISIDGGMMARLPAPHLTPEEIIEG